MTTPGRRRSRRDAGYTVVETLVAAALGMIVLAGVASVLTATLRAVQVTRDTSATTADLRTADEALSRALRVAVAPTGEPAAIVSGTSSSISFYALLNRSGAAQTTDAVPTLVSYTWDATRSCLTQTLVAGRALSTPNAAGEVYAWDAAPVTTCLLRSAATPTLSFTYYASATLNTDGTDGTALTAPLSASDLAATHSVGVRLKVPDPNNPGSYSGSVKLRLTLANTL